MTERTFLLRKVLEAKWTKPQIDHFLSYKLTAADFELVKETAVELLSRVAPVAFHLGAMSALWCAMLEDHSEIPVVVIAGSLEWRGKKIFTRSGPLPESTDGNIVAWDGHCGIEFGGHIGDISLFRTIKYGKVPIELKDFLLSALGEKRGMVCMTHVDFKK